MADKLLFIPIDDTKITPSVDHNKWLKRLDTQLNEPTNQNSIIIQKVVEPTNNKTFGTYNKQLIAPSLPGHKAL